MDDTSDSEYLRRIHSAQDFIENNLHRRLSLEEVAKAAAFSPYHFHRLFSAMTGESLYQFLLRIRLERAATVLIARPGESITEVALSSGFSSSATFARAFRSHFGASASEYRKSKNRKTLSKDCKELPDQQPYLDVEERNLPTRKIPMKTVKAQSITVEELPEKTLAYLRHVGPYAGDYKLFERLWQQFGAWAGPRGLFGRPGSEMLCIYHDNPDITDDDKLRLSLGVTVDPDTETSGAINLLSVAAGKYACARFEIDADEFAAAWQTLMAEWLPKSGYQPDDRPAYECYLNDPGSHPQKKHLVEIRLAVKPL